MGAGAGQGFGLTWNLKLVIFMLNFLRKMFFS